jgi:hypothetical protein
MLLSKLKNPDRGLIGKRVKIVGNTTGHQYGIGTIVKIEQWLNNNGLNVIIKQGGQYVSLNDMELIPMTIEELKKESVENINRIKDIEIENDIISAKIEFMETNGVDECDDETFKVMAILKKMNDATMTDLDKAKAISSIIKS